MSDPHVRAADVDQIAARLAALEAERAITQLMYRYSHAIDENDLAAYIDCFTPDGIWTSERPNGMTTRFQGPAEFAEFIRRHTVTDQWRMKHITVHPSITLLSDSEAAAHSYFLRIDTRPDDGPSYIWAMGHYLDRCVRGVDDTWRFVERKVVVEDRSSTPQ
ncbi:hypothetical protein GCM10022239_06160 [Leifsonia bigeumensis]|uniref:SnoaL-like domain-containing protein n=1 Tax=Leifsonella bigeumensis TaxID=433643 RepID=A0ABP7F6W1_9MICO